MLSWSLFRARSKSRTNVSSASLLAIGRYFRFVFHLLTLTLNEKTHLDRNRRLAEKTKTVFRTLHFFETKFSRKVFFQEKFMQQQQQSLENCSLFFFNRLRNVVTVALSCSDSYFSPQRFDFFDFFRF